MSTPHDPIVIAEPDAVTIDEITDAEMDQIFEDGVRDEFQMSGDEFLCRYERGELSDPAHPRYSRAFGLYVLRPR